MKEEKISQIRKQIAVFKESNFRAKIKIYYVRSNNICR